MTSPLSRSRSRRATSHIAVRVAHAVLGGLLAVGWLLLPVARAGADEVRDAPGRGGTSTGDLVLPLVAVVAAGALAAYSYVRRTRRARTRTTPGGGTPHPVPFAELDRRAGRLLVEIDDCVRGSTEELGRAADRFGEEDVAPYTKALAFARSELTASFRLWQRLDDTLTDDSLVRRQLLEEIVARCAEAGRRLDAEAPGFDLLRALERTLPAALESAEARFRELTARTPAAEATLTELRERYAPSASLSVAGNVEQAKDRLVFATTRLDRSRQSLDRGEGARATAHLRAAEAAVDQADLFVAGIDRLASELSSATALLPGALRDADTELVAARGLPAVGALPGRITHAASAVADVRRDITGGVRPYDPLGALRRLADAGTPLLAEDRVPVDRTLLDRAFLDHALLVARSVVALASDFVTTHRGAVGVEARTRLSEAERHLALAPRTLVDIRCADGLALEAQQLAERDVRAYGNPYAGPEGAGVGGAVLGGILLDDTPGAPAASFGGPRTRGRRDF
ncbi:hypothetical protein FNV62_33150 [Streptomyces sp. RLB3-17]|uniref:hypothetical protein n=1 Tax=unclassified Streptomyces TaxID=2593676 RepID=UPI001164259E|nr:MULTISPECIES: hypothetical protein [unclassified Streptomyces]QDN89923.1 hypothetical protein FNV61_34110 [Streptomyces sp. RLB3-6]QDO00550.1 hypothetical protein FNV58_35415 [Streptomyces sp. RLB1-9]QDO10769.1 hypothetical protein FNV68_35280 [Streptomyces sp. S1D4-23]QDO22280.1 hypothetical protein FNV65_33985 [Streptomyces sp. S1A1-8]QDO32406.1 hypothetical protein FNV63_34010 [Streptomyces sp. S1A1-3]